MLTLVYVSAVMGSLVAVIAQAKGRSPGLWLVYGLLLWPVALVHILRKKSTALEPQCRTLVPHRDARNWHSHAPGR
jgi:hypothetical protein